MTKTDMKTRIKLMCAVAAWCGIGTLSAQTEWKITGEALPEGVTEAVLEQAHPATEESPAGVSPVSENPNKAEDVTTGISDTLQDKARQHLPVTLDENNQLIDFEEDEEDENLLDLPESLKTE